MFIKDNISCRDNFIFVRNSNSEDIYEVVVNKIVYIDTRIELSFLIFLQLCVCCHDIDSAIIDSQMNHLRLFISSEKVFFNIWVEDFVECFSTLSFLRDLIVEIYCTIDDFLSEIVRKVCEYLHYLCFLHDYILWVFCDIILILHVWCWRLEVDSLSLKSAKNLLLSKFIVWFYYLDF